MHRRIVVALVAVTLVVLWSGVAAAGVPCVGTSTIVGVGQGNGTPNATVCPAGDLDVIEVTLTVRDCYGTPLPGLMATVYPVYVGGAVCFCPEEDSMTVGPTGATGTTYAYFRRFGGCGQIEFYADVSTITIGPSPIITIISPDIDGGCQANLIDFGMFAVSFLTTNPCCDFDWSGQVNLVDFGIFAVHFLHSCGP